MLSSKALKDIVTEARPIIERQIDDAELIAGFRDVVADAGGDWSALKALIKAQIQDERDETGNGKRVKKILDKAEFATGYADMLGWSNMNEKNFSASEPHDAETGELSPRLVKQVVDGMQTEAGRAALVAAVDIMIERADAEEQNSPETANEMDRATDGSLETGSEAAENARKAIPAQGPTSLEDGDVTHAGAGEIPATYCEYCDCTGDVHRIDGEWLGFCHCEYGKRLQGGAEFEIAPASQGEAEAPATDERKSPGFDDRSGEGANAGGDYVNSEATKGRGVIPTARKSLRPMCLKPDQCGGYGDKTCHSCLVAARTTGEAA